MSLKSLARRSCLGRKATAAVEFALIVPVLLLLLIGTSEILLLYRTEAKLNQLTANVAQMISLEPSPLAANGTGTSSISDVCNGAIKGLQPFPPNGLTIAVASVTLEVKAATPIYDVWESDVTSNNCTAAGGSSIGSANAITLATTGTGGGMLETPCDNMIIVKASLTYPGMLGLILFSKPTLTQIAYSRWRYATSTTELTCTGGCTLTPAVQTPICKL